MEVIFWFVWVSLVGWLVGVFVGFFSVFFVGFNLVGWLFFKDRLKFPCKSYLTSYVNRIRGPSLFLSVGKKYKVFARMFQ